MQHEKDREEVVGPYVEWPCVEKDLGAHADPGSNPMRLDRKPLDHQADCTPPADQAR